MTSNVFPTSPSKDNYHRATKRSSQHLRTSDAALPISSLRRLLPHTCSFAIFGRDIQPISQPSPLHLPTNPHRIPHTKATEQLEHSIPSVLDSAATILTSMDDSDDTGPEEVAVVAPANLFNLSNSPLFSRGLAMGGGEILHEI
ncbi:hypothetical protein BDQ12DRAFT_729736 [Crucibulum laeve]|uniref:Uncharacterized protein n=1 Tax=Crucibulum laeve TaxID=68775 RepID=A0A5C3LH56_9AGAR|nr:hypothetical protein BDQ12DRAFT_729736 [Crucibulum laeve]